MKRTLMTLTLVCLAGPAMAAGPLFLSVERDGADLIYRQHGKRMTLPEIQTDVTAFFRSLHNISPKMEFLVEVVPKGALPAEDLIPLLLCLKRAGVERCTLNLSQKMSGRDYWLPIEIDLTKLKETKTDKREEMLKQWGTHEDRPNKASDATSEPAPGAASSSHQR